MSLNVLRAGLVLLFFSSLFEVVAQKHDYNWIYSSRWPDSISLVKFHPKVEHSYKINPEEYRYSSTNATMSNESGRLIFSTNGCNVFNADQLVLENGSDINPGEVHDLFCNPRGYPAGHQTSIILPHPRDTSLYYIFHHKNIHDWNDTLDRIKTEALNYSIVDMSANSGLGKVLKKNIPVVSDTTLYAGCITAVRHFDDESWWLIFPHAYDSAYYRVLINHDTLISTPPQQIGKLALKNSEIGGGAQFTPDGSKYIRWNASDGIYIMDFDRSSGNLSNFQWIDHRIDSILFVGLAVSPNSRFLYTSADYSLYQYDLWADDIRSSRELIATYDGFMSPGPCTFWAGQLGPDCRIYFNSKGSCSWLHVIHKPNKKGKACDFRPHEFSIKSNHHGTMPHFPNYRLGTAPVCDSTLSVSVVTVPVWKERSEVIISPNPTTDFFEVITEIDYDVIRVMDVQGRKVFISDEKTFDISEQPSGLFLVQVLKNGKAIGYGRVVKID